jgi:hypothetical protein
MNGSGADAECLRRFEDPSPGRQLLLDALDDYLAHWTTPKPLSLAPRPREAALDALDNHGALELGKDAHHLKHRLTGWRASVDTLLMEVEINALGVEFAKEGDQLLQ